MPALASHPRTLLADKREPMPSQELIEAIHVASSRDQAVVHLQQAASFAQYLEGGEHHGGVTSEHHMDNAEAAENVRDQLRSALELLGVEA